MSSSEPNVYDTSSKPFSILPLREELLKSLAAMDHHAMTPIQEQSLPFMLDKMDMIAQAKTGSGKTAAFGLALLNDLNSHFFAIQGLILCPTRELAEQVCQVLRRLACMMPHVKILNLSGGMPMRAQVDSLNHSAHVIVGTPGRVKKHLQQASLKLDKLRTLVLDEADRMLDMGFFDDIQTIIESCPKPRQTLLFSATYPEEIKHIAQQFMNHPKEIHVKHTQEDELDIEHLVYEVKHPPEKFNLLTKCLLHFQPRSCLIFCNTKQQTADLAASLCSKGFSALELHGDMEQYDRDLAMIRFANQSCSILVATDLAARGLDVKALSAVINYDLAFELDVHIHRTGRTGRAGEKGLVISLTTPADATRLCMIESHQTQALDFADQHVLDSKQGAIQDPDMLCLSLNLGKKDKIRPGDILGALTKDAGLSGAVIGKINISMFSSYVAIHRHHADKASQYFKNGKIKGLKVCAKTLRS